jgi:hypothetical protein
MFIRDGLFCKICLNNIKRNTSLNQQNVSKQKLYQSGEYLTKTWKHSLLLSVALQQHVYC